MTDLINSLTHVSSKLRMLWGKNADSDAIDAAIEALKAAEEAPTPVVKTPRKTTKKATKNAQ
jgi:hypothetical protein